MNTRFRKEVWVEDAELGINGIVVAQKPPLWKGSTATLADWDKKVLEVEHYYLKDEWEGEYILRHRRNY